MCGRRYKARGEKMLSRVCFDIRKSACNDLSYLYAATGGVTWTSITKSIGFHERSYLNQRRKVEWALEICILFRCWRPNIIKGNSNLQATPSKHTFSGYVEDQFVCRKSKTARERLIMKKQTVSLWL